MTQGGVGSAVSNGEPGAAKAPAANPFFRAALLEAKDQLDHRDVPRIAPRPVLEHAVGAHAAQGDPEGMPHAHHGGTVLAQENGDDGEDPTGEITMQEEGPTCTGPTCSFVTCKNYHTCNGSVATSCTGTCTNFPTCNGSDPPTNCTTTCSNYPTCNGTGATNCTSTCTNYPTCNGAGTTNCTSTCQNFPTCGGTEKTNCQTTCKDANAYPTCKGTGATSCGQNTCKTYPTCNGTGATACTSTCSDWSTCNGQTITFCTNTCGDYPTCNVTCKSSKTCNGTPGCTTPTKDEWPSCKATNPTCSQESQTCKVTCEGYPTCSGIPPTSCGTTCAGWATCKGHWGQGCPIVSPFTLIAFGPVEVNWLPMLAGMTGVLAIRRRRVEAARA